MLQNLIWNGSDDSKVNLTRKTIFALHTDLNNFGKNTVIGKVIATEFSKAGKAADSFKNEVSNSLKVLKQPDGNNFIGGLGLSLGIGAANSDLMTHSAILSGAAIDHEISENPMRFVSSLKESEPSDRILTPKEKEKLFVLLNAKDISPARHRLRRIIFIALTTGWREGRIMAINKEDLDHENQLVIVVRSKQDESKKVRVASLTWEILTDFASRVRHGRIFRNLSDGSPLKHFLDDDWRELLKDAKIKDLTFHNLCATVGTEMILSGASSFEAQQALGRTFNFSIAIKSKSFTRFVETLCWKSFL